MKAPTFTVLSCMCQCDTSQANTNILTLDIQPTVSIDSSPSSSSSDSAKVLQSGTSPYIEFRLFLYVHGLKIKDGYSMVSRSLCIWRVRTCYKRQCTVSFPMRDQYQLYESSIDAVVSSRTEQQKVRQVQVAHGSYKLGKRRN